MCTSSQPGPRKPTLYHSQYLSLRGPREGGAMSGKVPESLYDHKQSPSADHEQETNY